MRAALTLPGIAALILGIGMAVDANIIKFERIKEEIRSGKSLLSSVIAGSKQSIRTIMDANITTIITCVVLYFIGNGAIKGFAITMIVSILTSILTNVYLSKFLLNLLVRGNVFRKPSYFGVKEADIREL
jgi:SecD/SecF fusion protein